MKHLIRWLVVLLIILPACESTEVIPLPGSTVSGQIYTLDEFGEAISDKAGATVTVRGTSPLLSSVTDAEGNFKISDVPAGTYNLEVTKDGYGTMQYQGVSVVGEADILTGRIPIVRKSTTTIENPTLEIQGTSVYLHCIVNHNFQLVPDSYKYAYLVYVISDSENVSYLDYTMYGTVTVNVATGSEIVSRVYQDLSYYPSGSRIYVRVYGCALVAYYDIMMNRTIFSSVGEPSDVATIILP